MNAIPRALLARLLAFDALPLFIIGAVLLGAILSRAVAP